MPHSEAAPAASGAGENGSVDDLARAADYPGNPRVIPRSEHGISRRDIDPNALKVLYRLNKAGYSAHLVGGGVRDLLLGLKPKDFDIATDATPDQVRALFRNCRVIGRRFRLAHVVFGRDVIEVATFRAAHDTDDRDGALHDDGRILRDNVFGSIEEDAFRRDFTINALYYDIGAFAVLDYTGGMADIGARRLRLIGDADVRYREDPVRMLRVARFAARLGFRVDHATAEPMDHMGELLRDIPPSRLFEEALKLFHTGHAVASLKYLRAYSLFRHLFPDADAALRSGTLPHYEALVQAALANTDRRISEGRPVTPAFLYAVFLWPSLLERAAEFERDGESAVMSMQRAASRVIEVQQQFTALPKRFAGPMREIWVLQPKLERYRGKRGRRLLAHPRLRAAWDFLCLRRDAGEALDEICDHWGPQVEAETQPAAAAPAAAPAPTGEATESRGGRRRGGRRRRRRGGRGKGDASG